MSLLNASIRFAHGAGAFARQSWRRAVRQERMLATATFALIASTTLAGLDYVITGDAPDWTPVDAAYAQEVRVVAHHVEAPASIKIEPPSPLTETRAEVADFSFTTEVLLGGPDATEPGVAVTSAAFAPAQIKPFAANRL
ncbi:MAG TPA: hypothetical protein VEA80_11060 [Vitreimonas sp.]|uniref:hypothetical protein n=1 Tax=Vitreimonas sp. TaxID=3069702 RepID=UPI002D58C0D7|nr:hypothetical protein [Vitreimonas sp.]HYD88006.1 hypothetical protein [Vitreimonas sp.]